MGQPDEPAREDEAPRLRDFMERSIWRLLLEGALGAGGGVVFASLLPAGQGRAALFAIVGAVAAPLALLLTPVGGGVVYRGVRYGAALAVLLTLVVSFVAGEDILLEELLALGAIFFAVGGVGHGIMAASLGRHDLPEGRKDLPGVDSRESEG
jgi:hypothetical protein